MGKQILLIDDDALLCEVLAEFLELSGYAVIQAANGRAGLERLASGAAPDLILLDLLMPEMDGIRFLGELGKLGQGLPPVLVLSASATASIVDALQFSCVAGVIRKPVQPPVLIERIAALIGPG